MKALITATGQFGPFATIVDSGDRWDCDVTTPGTGTSYPKGVIGEAHIGEWVPPPPPAPVVVVPAVVTDKQLRQALTRTKLRSAVESAVAAGDQDLKDEWDRSTEVHRDNALVVAMAHSLGVTDAQLDDLFILAGSL